MRVTSVTQLALATVYIAACTGGAPAAAAPTASPLAPTPATTSTAVPERQAATPAAMSEPVAVVASGACPVRRCDRA